MLCVCFLCPLVLSMVDAATQVPVDWTSISTNQNDSAPTFAEDKNLTFFALSNLTDFDTGLAQVEDLKQLIDVKETQKLKEKDLLDPDLKELRQAFDMFKDKFAKIYDNPEEEALRWDIFKDSYKLINSHNDDYRSGKAKFLLELNEFADLTDEEFSDKYLGLILPKEFSKSWQEDPELQLFETFAKFVTNSYDWRKQGKITKIRNQGECSSCWAFAATAAIESAWAIRGFRLQKLSEQHLLDCVDKEHGYPCEGCNGGWPLYALDYVKKNNGIAKNSKYPYVGVKKRCRYRKKMRGATIKKYSRLKKLNATVMSRVLVAKGPITVLMSVKKKFRFYKTGIFDDTCSQEPEDINHAVTVIGYLTSSEDPKGYWIVKNSWGRNWGDKGYMKIKRGINMCAIEAYPVLPIV